MISRLLLPALALALSVSVCQSASIVGKHPNIIFILTDDQGFGDVSANGNPVLKTPNMDRIHDEGVRFLDFHVSPTCSPTRSALHTGRHEFRNGITHTILERERMTLDATTLPQVLKTTGYTTGIFGKWHLGDEADHQPGKRGYDEVFIHGAGGIGQSFPGSCADAPGNTYFSPYILHNGKFEKTDGYCTDVFFAQATKWIESVKGKQPFYAYIATNAPHAPLQVRDEDLARYKDKVPDEATAKFFGMVANIDDNIGKLLAKLKEWDIEKDTLVIFMNDNGGTGGTKVFNAGMRGQKGTPYIGGTRASSFWRWPGTLTPGDVKALSAHIDFFPTIATMAGATLTDQVKAQIEGRSLVPWLEKPDAPAEDRTLFTHVGRWEKGKPPESGKYRSCSVRTTRWNLVQGGGGKRGEAVNNWMLFDVQADPGEQTDVAATNAEVVGKMSADYEKWWTSVRPMMINEDVPLAEHQPFRVLYEEQIGPVKESASPRARKRAE
jgi:arylsulfatase